MNPTSYRTAPLGTFILPWLGFGSQGVGGNRIAFQHPAAAIGLLRVPVNVAGMAGVPAVADMEDVLRAVVVLAALVVERRRPALAPGRPGFADASGPLCDDSDHIFRDATAALPVPGLLRCRLADGHLMFQLLPGLARLRPERRPLHQMTCRLDVAFCGLVFGKE